MALGVDREEDRAAAVGDRVYFSRAALSSA